MNRNSFHLLFVLSLTAFLASSAAVTGQVPQAQVPGPKVKPTVPLPVKECRDPAAESLTFVILSRDAAHPMRGQIRITGVVRNVGNAEFVSDPRQAKAILFETPQGASPTDRAHQAIARLAPGASLTLTYQTSWDSAREFPPKYTLLVDYDPDIRSDANRKNDDCNANNNRRELTGEQINRGWR